MSKFSTQKKIPFEEGSIDLVIDGVGIVKTREMSSKYISPGGLIVHIGLGQPKEGLDIRRNDITRNYICRNIYLYIF